MVDLKIEFDAVKAVGMISYINNHARWMRVLKALVATIAFRDVIDHFKNEEGPGGKWPTLSASYEKWKLKKGLTKQLVLTGHLRQNFLHSNVRDEGNSAVAFFNPVEYAGLHDQGRGKIKQRQFMWLSGKASGFIAQGLVDTILKGA